MKAIATTLLLAMLAMPANAATQATRVFEQDVGDGITIVISNREGDLVYQHFDHDETWATTLEDGDYQLLFKAELDYSSAQHMTVSQGDLKLSVWMLAHDAVSCHFSVEDGQADLSWTQCHKLGI